MNTLYLICVAVGGTLFAIHFLLTLFGFGHGHGGFAHGAHGHSMPGVNGESGMKGGMVSFRAMVCALLVFGLGGLGTVASGFSPEISVFVASICAGASMVMVGLLTHSMTKLDSDGTLDIRQAIGRPGTVYLTIPAARAGLGKVTVSLQNRTMEFQALTSGASIPSGAKIIVSAVIGSDTVEVLPHATTPV